jgi:GntR family transcriptional regulator of vanillate catabolism
MPPVQTTTSQSDRALFLLREQLLTGQFRPGQRLTELELVERLGVSRTPVRYALTRLAADGLIETIPRGGFRVCAFTLDEVWDAIEMRGVLEGTAARLAAERLDSQTDLDRLRAIQADLEALAPLAADSFGPYLKGNEAFHDEIVHLARSPILLRSVECVRRLPFAGPGALVFGEREVDQASRIGEIALAQHRALIEAIADREGTRAEHVAREHSRIARKNLERALADPQIFARFPGASLVTQRRAG